MFQISCSSNLNTIYKNNNSKEILTNIQNTNSKKKKIIQILIFNILKEEKN